VALAALAVPHRDPERLAEAAAKALAAPDIAGDWNVALAVGLGSDGSTVALCLERSGGERAGRQPDERAGEEERHGPGAAGE
jgi:hypothetical protein